MSTSIILFSHGSVLCGAGESLRAMAQELEDLAGCKVGVGYLNYSEPSFADAVDSAVANGANEIIVVPYFLVAGYFVQQKLPPLIEVAKERHPQIIFHVADAICANPLMSDIVLACAARTQTIDEWRKWWRVAPEFCRNDAACPLYDTAFCAVKENPPDPLYKGELRSGEIVPREKVPTELSFLRTHAWGTRESSKSTKSALLILVHGSPREESNVDMYEVVEQVRAVQKYFYVQVGFLECNDPPIPQAIEKCIEAGAERIIAVPYFLHAGRHVADDLPGFLEEASDKYPQLEFLMGDYLGRELSLTKVLLQMAKKSSTHI
jgi:sirohydrochlorin cobaltochelatase